ncbi:MAG TPA: DUF1460 domain-containing protein [Ignavibacteriaceae bacterium]|jgi:hypothetical protein|nr:DUF1460 domain-containing protein [Ignavibacteriaceae bacterium]
MKKLFLLIVLVSVLSTTVFPQIYTDEDVKICESKFSLALEKNLYALPLNDVIAEIGKSFLGVDYVAHSIEKDGEEQLVVFLTGLDCTTFLENCLTFGRLIKQNKISFEDYKEELTKIRYRNGVIDRYPSRLHYFSDWIHNNTKKGIVKDITKEIGGELTKFNVSFMSKNPDKYKHLKENPEFVPVIEKQEKEINSRKYYYIPKNKVEEHESKIQNGDLIAITTNLSGLDIGHVGVAVKMDDGRIHFMHAPLVGAKVEISENPLPGYLAKVKKHTGIIVLRPVEPK